MNVQFPLQVRWEMQTILAELRFLVIILYVKVSRRPLLFFLKVLILLQVRLLEVVRNMNLPRTMFFIHSPLPLPKRLLILFQNLQMVPQLQEVTVARVFTILYMKHRVLQP